jgi:hypothetical protein
MFSQDIQGVWAGTIYNDTTRKYIPYEITISESKGKISGYSHTVFMDGKKEVAGVKSLKIKRKNSKILIEDDELIYNNYSEPPPKGVKQYSILNVMQGDSGLLLIGVFNTNKTKEYASLTGTIRLQKKEKFNETKIITKLDQLQLLNALSFIPAKQTEKDVVAIVTPKVKDVQSLPAAKPEKETIIFLPNLPKQTASSDNDDADTEPVLIAIKEDTITYRTDVVKGKDLGVDVKVKKTDIVKSPPVVVKKQQPVTQPKKQIVSVPESVKKQINAASKKEITTTNQQPVALARPKPVLVPKLLTKPDVITQPVKKENIVTQTTPTKKTEIASLPKEKPKETVTPVTKPIQNLPPVFGTLISTEELAKRKIETIRTVNFKSDSLVLTLYDNGVIDGDSVSVILNGKTIISKKMLTANPLNKTIYITPDLGDSLQLILYAENLGSIAPNTGLLMIQDGTDQYQIRFSGDLQKNSAIILKRRGQQVISQ